MKKKHLFYFFTSINFLQKFHLMEVSSEGILILNPKKLVNLIGEYFLNIFKLYFVCSHHKFCVIGKSWIIRPILRVHDNIFFIIDHINILPHDLNSNIADLKGNFQVSLTQLHDLYLIGAAESLQFIYFYCILQGFKLQWLRISNTEVTQNPIFYCLVFFLVLDYNLHYMFRTFIWDH